MNFVSPEFILCFPLVLAVFWRLPGKYRWILLLAASFFFYFGGEGYAVLALLLSTLFSYLAALKIAGAQEERKKKRWLGAVLAYCLGSLFFFKQERFQAAGISFYTFQILSYVLDVYRGKEPAEQHPGFYALFVSFFPQLVAGPIEKSGSLLPQLKKINEKKTKELLDGLWLMLRGFFKKIAAADYLAGFVERAYETPAEASALTAVVGTVFFAIQIYCDFSGYTDIARGAAQMLGIHLMENFAHPYRAENIREFWRRWHMSLTGWFTEYVYIPLGGNRKGTLRRCVNILTVFALSGLWHGLSAHFVVWGLLHGMLLVIYSLWREKRKPAPTGRMRAALNRLATFSVVCFTWIFFRAESLGDALTMLGRIVCRPFEGSLRVTMGVLQIQQADCLRLGLVFLCLWALQRAPETPGRARNCRQVAAKAFLYYAMITATVASWLSNLAAGSDNVFLYFRF